MFFLVKNRENYVKLISLLKNSAMYKSNFFEKSENKFNY